MNFAVIYASKHESTEEVAEAIAAAIRSGPHSVDLLDAAKISRLPDADAYVLGSGVYGGRWLKPARELVEAHADALRTHPVWLFSVGPLGDEDEQIKAGIDASSLLEATGARSREIFSGRLDPDRLGLTERFAAKAVKAPTGDYRDWEAIERWARQIAHSSAIAGDGANGGLHGAGVTEIRTGGNDVQDDHGRP
jgi:menaquinone-dependent protoporphyrinogen oxidase